MIDATLLDTLGELDEAVNYRAWIIDLARPFLTGTILEIGAGHGTFTDELAELAPVFALEPDRTAFELLRQRCSANPLIEVCCGTLDDIPPGTTFGSAVMLNVLEHIRDDAGALRHLVDLVAPGGNVAIWVPAFSLLYSDFDRKLGHYRRYGKAELVGMVEDAGWSIERAHYVNLPGWFSWLLITRLLGCRPTAGPLISIFDRFVVPAVRALESRVRPPFGQSILLIARKPDS